jgi:hypothetical protein
VKKLPFLNAYLISNKELGEIHRTCKEKEQRLVIGDKMFANLFKENAKLRDELCKTRT